MQTFMRKLARPWTEEDDALLRKLACSGASAMRASVAMKRSKSHLISRARELGVPFADVRVQRKMRARAEEEQRQREGLPRTRH